MKLGHIVLAVVASALVGTCDGGLMLESDAPASVAADDASTAPVCGCTRELTERDQDLYIALRELEARIIVVEEELGISPEAL